MTSEKFSIRKRIKSFSYAFRGLGVLLREEHNSRIHLVAALLVVTLGFVFEIKAYEWLVVIVAIVMVFAAELFNSAIEHVADAVSKEFHPAIRNAKDMAAGGVLIISIGAAIAGLIIFIPYIIKIFNNV